MNIVNNLFYKFSGLFLRLHKIAYGVASRNERKNLQLSQINKEKWYSDNVEKTLRYDYVLTQDSIVLDVGGYEGDFASEIYARYLSNIYVFEPVSIYVDKLNKRFKNNTRIHIISKGLGAKNEEITINIMDEASSHTRANYRNKKGTEEKIQIVDVISFLKEHNIDKVALIKINIEGAEYDLLDRLIESDKLGLFANFQIQFHDFYPGYKDRYASIVKALEKTHQLTYNYPFVWENWQLKNN